MSDHYKVALQKAVQEYAALTKKEQVLALRKSRVKDTIDALKALCSGLPDVASLSLADSIRVVISAGDRYLTPIEVRGKLEEIGYNLSKYSNPLASIHTALNRMAETGELDQREDEDQKRIFAAGENMKKPAASIEEVGETIEITPESLEESSEE